MPASGKIVASERMIPLPMAVPRCSWNLSMAATMSSRFCVGGWTTAAVPAKDTTPTRTPRGRSATNALAASCAATSRFGSTSLARMLPDTSMARMMVCCCIGSLTMAAGRATATSIVSKRQQEEQRRQVAPEALTCGHRLLHDAQARVPERRPLLPPEQENIDGDQRRHGRHQPEHVGPQERHDRLRSRCAGSVPPPANLAAPLPEIGEAQDRVDQIVVRGQLECVHARVAERRSERVLASLRGRGEALPEPAVVGVEEHLLTGLGVLDDEQPEVRQIHLQGVVDAHRQDLMPLREVCQRRRPAGRADEVRDENTSDRRGMT